MITLLKKIFLQNWQRKLLSLVLAIIIWLVVHHSMTTTKTISQIPVRIKNLDPDKTIEGMQENNFLPQKISLIISGTRNALDLITAKDLEVAIDASNQPNEWNAVVTKQHLVSLNPSIYLTQLIHHVVPVKIPIKQVKLVHEKIPVVVTQPIGEPPKGYQFLDAWPYHLSLLVKGPEETIKWLKRKGVKLTFNLSDISCADLEMNVSSQEQDAITFWVPDSWKKVTIPCLGDTPIEIQDPQAKLLRIHFIKQDLLPITAPVPITIFYPPKHASLINPQNCSILTSSFITKKNGIPMTSVPLYASGVSKSFLNLVQDMLQIVIVAVPKSETKTLEWHPQIVCPNVLEDRYLAQMASQLVDPSQSIQHSLREEYLRNRFRNYMSRLRIYTPNHEKLSLSIQLVDHDIIVTPKNYF